MGRMAAGWDRYGALPPPRVSALEQSLRRRLPASAVDALIQPLPLLFAAMQPPFEEGCRLVKDSSRYLAHHTAPPATAAAPLRVMQSHHALRQQRTLPHQRAEKAHGCLV